MYPLTASERFYKLFHVSYINFKTLDTKSFIFTSQEEHQIDQH